MTQPGRVADMRGMTLIDRDGQRIGKVDDLYVDDEDGQLEWALVHTGLFGVKRSFVPLRGATQRDGDMQVPVTKAQVKDAPRIAADGELSAEEKAACMTTTGSPPVQKAHHLARRRTGKRCPNRPRLLRRVPPMMR
jgi:sporulation protein YlmC with PRC-barrel domain